MRLVDVHARLLKMGVPVFQTSDAAALLGAGSAHASKLLARLATSGHLTRLGRGRWGFGERIDPFALPGYLTAPYPSYVSLQSALYHYGMISQIPSVLYAVSAARTRLFRALPELEFPAGFKVAEARRIIGRIRSIRRRNHVSRRFEEFLKASGKL